jgi:putative membrane protein
VIGRPRSLYALGEEPDPRFTLANERTFLAWIRTALALIAGGVALEVLGLDLHPGLRLTASLILIISGLITPALAYIGWYRAEWAMRRRHPLPALFLGPALASAVAAAGVVITLAVMLR